MTAQFAQCLKGAVRARHHRLQAPQIALAELELGVKLAIVNDGGSYRLRLAAIQAVERVLPRYLDEFDIAAPLLDDAANQIDVEAAQFALMRKGAEWRLVVKDANAEDAGFNDISQG